MQNVRQILRRVFEEVPAANSLVDLAPDVARTVLRGFILLAIAGEAFGPAVDCLWHLYDVSHPAWFSTHWLNVGLAAVWAVSLWVTYLLPLTVSVLFFSGVAIVAGASTVFLTGGIDSPNAIFFAVPILLGPLFLGLRGSFVVLMMACGAYVTLYSLEAHIGFAAPAMERGDKGLTHTIITVVGLGVIWFMGWMIGASLRFPLYERIRTGAVQEALLVERERLLAMVSHELRTPLTNIVGFIEMIRHRASDVDAEVRQGLHFNALQLLTMVNNLLDYAKLKQPEQHGSVEPVQVPELAGQVLAMFSPALARQSTVSELRQHPLDFPYLSLDRFALERVLINLVSNAAKHTKKGRVLVEVDWQADVLSIKVSDTGSGMSAETQARVFEPFFHDASTGVAGTGLGMALVQQMVDRMHGRVTVTSELGLGTSVTVLVPATVASPTVQAPRTQMGAGQGMSEVGTFLFVEDQPDIRALIEAFAQALDMRVRVVAGQADIDAHPDRFVAAFVDLQLAGTSGVDVLKSLKANRPELVVWAMTANVMFRPDDGTTAPVKFDGVLYKPFTMQQLEEALRAASHPPV